MILKKLLMKRAFEKLRSHMRRSFTENYKLSRQRDFLGAQAVLIERDNYISGFIQKYHQHKSFPEYESDILSFFSTGDSYRRAVEELEARSSRRIES